MQKHSLIIALSLTLASCTPAVASEIPYEKAVRAVMGEAGGQPYRDKLAIACAIRNRGHLGGVYGLRSKTIYGPEVWQECAKAWAESETNDITQGADHWLSAWDIKHCRPRLIAWRHRMVKTLETRDFTFYSSK